VRFRLAFVVIPLLSGIGLCRPAAASGKPLEGRVVVLDPGHAVKNDAGKMINPGAQGKGGVLERDVALRVAETIAPLLEAQGAKVYMTRTHTNPWRYGSSPQADNRGRAILANLVRADAYIRIHCDWNRDKRFRGFTTFFYRWKSRPLAEAVHDALANALPGHRDNGIKRRSFVSASAHMPSVLIELGVLSNKVEGKELMQEEHDSHLAMAVTEGIIDYFHKMKT
jgi:N-acetylmuramoyl-L-alanine amidase